MGGGTRRGRGIAHVLVAVLAVACEGPSPEPDAGEQTDGGPAEPLPAAPPAGPRPPAWSCPDGWIEVPIEGGHSCAPWAERPSCAPGELLGAGGCEPLASDCGTDAPPDLSDAMAFVRPGALDGDGSRERPFGTVSEATRAGFKEIALAPGEHVLAQFPPRGLTLVGTCPTATTLRLQGITTLEDATIRRARVTGRQLSVPRGRTLSLEGVELSGMVRSLQVHGALRARRVAIRDASEIAILGLNPDSIELEDVSLENMPEALWAGQPSDEPPHEPRARVTLTRVVAAGIERIAVQADTLTSLELSGVVIEDALAGIVTDVDALVVHDTFVRRTAQIGVGAIGSGSRELARLHVESADRGGVHLAGGTFDAHDLVILASGLALSTGEGERGRAERVFVAGARTYAIEADGGEVALSDVRVAGVEATTNDTGGALSVVRGARVTLERARVTGTEHFGIVVSAGTLEADDVAVEDVRSRTGEDGYGFVVIDGARLELARARVERVGAAGVALEDASATIEDLTVASVRAPTDTFGAGVLVRAGRDGSTAPATLELRRATIRATHRAGIVVFGPAATLQATDLFVEDSRASVDGGIAIAVMERASLCVERFVVRGSALAGVLLDEGTSAELVRGRIESNPIGLLTDPSLGFNHGARPGLSMREVVFVDNELDHQPTRRELPAPGPIVF